MVQNYVNYIQVLVGIMNIIVIDNRFISERVNQLRNWNMEFIQGDILDKDFVKKYFMTQMLYII